MQAVQADESEIAASLRSRVVIHQSSAHRQSKSIEQEVPAPRRRRLDFSLETRREIKNPAHSLEANCGVDFQMKRGLQTDPAFCESFRQSFNVRLVRSRHMRSKTVEGHRIVDRNFAEHLSIEQNICVAEGRDKLAVSNSAHSACCGDTSDPKAAEISATKASMNPRIASSTHQRNLGLLFQTTLGPEISTRFA